MCALWGLGIRARKVTISTVGLPKFIERLATEFELPVTLALSLHAPNDEIRRKLIPWAEYCTVAELLASCQKWFAKTGREITLEYTLLRGVNDRPEHARELAEIAKTIRANINLIRYNEVDGLEFQRPRDEDVRKFQEFLKSKSINTHIRSSHIVWLIFIVAIAIVKFYFHELWKDEWQAWFVAKDKSVPEIFSVLYYRRTP